MRLAGWYWAIPLGFWAVVIAIVVFTNARAFGLTQLEAFLVTALLWVIVNCAILLCSAVFIEEPRFLPAAVYRAKSLITIGFIVTTCLLPIIGTVFVHTLDANSLEVPAGHYLLLFGILPFIIASITTFYAAVEKVVEDSGAKSERHSQSSGLPDEIIINSVRSFFLFMTTIIAVATIGRTGQTDRMVESSASGVYTALGMTFSFFGFISIYYWASPVAVVSSVYIDHSVFDLIIFTIDNFFKALFGDFPELADFNLNNVRHNNENLLVTLTIGIYRLLTPLALLLILVGSPRGSR